MSDRQQELEHINLVRNHGFRLVKSPKRARKLRGRGEGVRWSEPLHGWIWKPRKGDETA